MKQLPIFSLFLLIVLAVACKKDKTYSYDPAKDHVTADLLLSDILHMADAESRITEGIKSTDYPCLDTTSVDTVSSPKTMLLNFLDTECPGKFGWSREGVLILSYSDKYSVVGSQLVISAQQFFIEGWRIDGIITMEYNGLNADNQPHWSVFTNDMKFTSPSGGVVSRWSTNQVRRMTEGLDTDYTIDDVFKITGSSTGTDRDGNSYSASYNGSVRDKTSCPIPSAGTTTISSGGDPVRTINYGGGACDDVVRIEIEDQSELFTFP